jgi:predicted nuclease of predicted toxin-antitoxin system
VGLFPDSTHVQDVGLDTADDTKLWDYARDNDYLIVSKDTDFSDRSAIHGFPPKVIWLRRGNCSTNTVEKILRNHYSDIEIFDRDPNTGLLILL